MKNKIKFTYWIQMLRNDPIKCSFEEIYSRIYIDEPGLSLVLCHECESIDTAREVFEQYKLGVAYAEHDGEMKVQFAQLLEVEDDGSGVLYSRILSYELPSIYQRIEWPG